MCCPALLRACGNHSAEAERSYGIGLKLFGFIPEPVFTFIPESCSGSTRNTVRNHPGIAFTLPRIPQADIEQGLVPLRDSKRKTSGVNLDVVAEHLEWGKTEHVRILNELRNGELLRPTTVEWVKKSFRHFKLDLHEEQWRKLADGLEAAIKLNSFFCNQAVNGVYDFAHYASDWIDLHQLFYLSDPTVHFLTNDKRLKNLVSSSDQSDRILLANDLLKSMNL